MPRNNIESNGHRSSGDRGVVATSKRRLQRQRAQRRGWNNPDVAVKWVYGGVTEQERLLVNDALVDYGFYKGLSSKSNVLDVGPGVRSYVDREKLPAGSHLHAIDISIRMLDALRMEQPQQHDSHTVADVAQLPLPDDSFDCSVGTFFMRYLPLYGQLDAILELVRATQDRGEIHIIDYDKLFHPGEVRAFSPQLLEDYLSRPHMRRRLDALGKEIDIETHTLNSSYKMPFPQRLDHMKFTVRKKS